MKVRFLKYADVAGAGICGPLAIAEALVCVFHIRTSRM
jgi:hypothetical protein